MTTKTKRKSASSRSVPDIYPKPGPTGGQLIRDAIGLLRDHGVRLPIAHILIAVSGGLDSMALAHLLIRYGRRVGDSKNIRILHINHGWRGAESDADARFVRKAAKDWAVPLSVHKLRPPSANKAVPSGASSGSWEELARAQRKRIFDHYKERGWTVFTAHHADDLAETVLWRIFTGNQETHGAGIAVQHDSEIRPLLRSKKAQLRKFLEEEGVLWREDVTNTEGRFLRSKMRLELIPVLERLFPRAKEHLTRAALNSQKPKTSEAKSETKASSNELDLLAPGILVSAAGLRLRSAQWKILKRHLLERGKDSENWSGEVHLPGGWRLICSSERTGEQSGRRASSERQLKKAKRRSTPRRKWILEKI